MTKENLSPQELQVNRILEKIEEITGSSANTLKLSTQILKEVISMRECQEPGTVICKKIARMTSLNETDPKIKAILCEIDEKPFDNNYKPFDNTLFANLKRDLESL